MWEEITAYQEFALDKNGNYANNKAFLFPATTCSYVSILN